MEALTISSVTTRVKDRVAAFAVFGHGGPLFKALVQYDFRDNCLNIINYLGLFAGSCGASRAGACYKANRLI